LSNLGVTHILADGSEGPPVEKPVNSLGGVVPQGQTFYGVCINESIPGSATFNAPAGTQQRARRPAAGSGARTAAVSAATGEIRVQGSGWGGAMGDPSRTPTADQGYFAFQPVTGNFRARVTALTRPTATHPWARGVLMLREKLNSTSRYIALGPTAQQGLYSSQRLIEAPASSGNIAWGRRLDDASLTLPLVLEIVRTTDPVARDQVIELGYSTDGGRTFVQASRLRRQTYPDTVNVGMMVSSNDRGKLSEMRFTGFEVQKL
jgi:hypothetical protein